MGVIDTLSAGFSMVVRRPWLLIVPLLLDLALLVGPKVSVLPLLDGVDRLLEESQYLAGESAVVGSDLAALSVQMDLLRSAIGSYNLASLVAVNRVVLPSIAGLRAIKPDVDHVIQVGDPVRAILLAALLLAVGLFIACIYWTPMAQETRGRHETLAHLGRAVPIFWLRALGVAGIVLALFAGVIGVGIMLALVAQVFTMMGAGGLAQAIVGFFTFILWLVGAWVFFYLFFVPQALTLAEASPLTAIRQSILVVRTALWRSLGLIILVNLISTGLGYLWGAMLGTTLGTVVAIAANAFVGTGLVAAVFIYFRDRIIALQQAQQQARA